MIANYGSAVARSAALLVLAVAGLIAVAFAFVGLVLGLGVGAIFLFKPIVRLTRGLATLQRSLARQWSGVVIESPYRPLAGKSGLTDVATWRDLLWLLLEPVVAVPVTIGCVLFGYAVGPQLIRAHSAWAGLLLRPTGSATLRHRVSDLAKSRTQATDAQAAELRRIERDLHDGAQARIVAMGMILDMAQEVIDEDPNAAKELLTKARDSSKLALQELRDLVRGVHPPVLAERGLADAVRALALDSPLEVEVAVELPARPEAPVESAVYFGLAELITNAAKHSAAQAMFIDIRHDGSVLWITVVDDGHGGADASRGSGLRGIQRRLAVFDGVLSVASPAGGPTVIGIELPCALSRSAKPAQPPT